VVVNVIALNIRQTFTLNCFSN